MNAGSQSPIQAADNEHEMIMNTSYALIVANSFRSDGVMFFVVERTNEEKPKEFI